jgi:hypothetical protein
VAIAVTTVALLTAPALPASATIQGISTQRGPVVDAFFSTEPANPAPGDTYREITVYANRFKATGDAQPGPVATVDIKQFQVNSDGRPTMVSETMTGMQGAGPVLTLGAHLSSAKLDVTFAGSKTCTADGKCTPSAGGAVSLTWTATGDRLVQVRTDLTTTKGRTYYSYERTLSRAGSVTGTVFGQSVTTSREGTDIARYTFWEYLG